MLFYTSDITVLATLINEIGEQTTISISFKYAKRGLFKEEMERQILAQFNSSELIHKIIKVRVH